MIKTFKDDQTQKIYQRQRSRKLPPDIQQVALRKLRMINNAISINDLRIPPANRLENSVATEQVNGVFESMINGVSVLNGKEVTLIMSRSWITTKGRNNYD